MDTDPSHKISICLASERARERVARAIGVVGAHPTITSFAQLQVGDLPAVQGLVYDLHPWTPTAGAALISVLRAYPNLRVLLYVPIRADSFEMLPRFGGMDRVCSKVQHFSVATFGLLCGFVRFVNTGDAYGACERVVEGAMPYLPQNMRSILRAATAQVIGTKAQTVHRVTGMARDLRVSSRTLRRKLGDGGLPPPKEFLDWMLLMYVADQAAREGLPTASVARRIGYDANAFYRIKKRRLGHSVAGNQLVFELVRDGFLRRCQSLSGEKTEDAGPLISQPGVPPAALHQNVAQPVPHNRRLGIVPETV